MSCEKPNILDKHHHNAHPKNMIFLKYFNMEDFKVPSQVDRSFEFGQWWKRVIQIWRNTQSSIQENTNSCSMAGNMSCGCCWRVVDRSHPSSFPLTRLNCGDFETDLMRQRWVWVIRVGPRNLPKQNLNLPEFRSMFENCK